MVLSSYGYKLVMFLWSERFVYDHPNDVIILLKSGQIRRNDGQLGVSFVNLSTGLQRQHNLSYIGPRLLPSLQSSCIRLTVQRMDLSATLCLSTRTRKALVTGHPSHRQDAPVYARLEAKRNRVVVVDKEWHSSHKIVPSRVTSDHLRGHGV